VNVGAAENVRLVVGAGAETEKPKKRMPLIGNSSLSALRESGARRRLLSVGGPAGGVDDITADADATTPPLPWAGRAKIAEVPPAMPDGGLSVGSVTAAAAGTDATEAVDVNAARL